MSDLKNRIAFLEETHDMLDREITKLEASFAPDEEVHATKKKRLFIKDQITELKDKQGKEFV